MISDNQSVKEINIETNKSVINENKSNDYSIITNDNIIEIDGSILEGGGQILRISLTLSILFKKKMKIYNIRGNRSNPGLQRQHMAATTSIADLTESKLENVKISSKELTIDPGSLKEIKSNSKCDCNGAGSIGLLIQQILPCVIFSPVDASLELVGGTIVSHAPPTYYIEDVLRKILNDKMNIEFSIEVKRQGVFPEGGGIINFKTKPVKYITPINLTTRGKLTKVLFRVSSTNNFKSYATSDVIFKEAIKGIKKILRSYLQSVDENLKSTEFEIEDHIQFETKSDVLRSKKGFTLFGQIVMIFENTIVSVEQLYSEKKDSQELKNFNIEMLSKLEETLSNDNICLDEFTVDHMVIFMALAKGKSKIHIGEISNHTLTAFEVIKKFVPSIKIELTKFETYNCIEIEGISWYNEY